MSQQGDNKKNQAEQLLSAEQAESIKGFSFKKDNLLTQVNFVDGSRWEVSSQGQSNYAAQMSLVQSLIQNLNSNNMHKVEKAQKKGAQFELNIYFNDSSQQKIIVYNEKSFDGQVFLETQGESYVSTPFWKELFDRFEFRQKEIFLLDYGLKKVTIVHNKKKRTYLLENKFWLTNQADNKMIEDKKMVEFFKKLMKIDVLRFVSDKKEVGLIKSAKGPRYQMLFEYEEVQKNWQLELVGEGRNIYGSVVQLETYFQLKQDSIVKLREALNFIE